MARPGYDRPRSKSPTPADRRAANADAGQESVFNQIGIGVGNPLYSTALHIQKQHITNVMVDRLQTSQFGPTLQLRKARGDLDEPLTVADEDYCGLIAGYGYVGATNQFLKGASIEILIDGTPSDSGSGALPSSLRFRTRTTAGAEPTICWMDAEGNVGIGDIDDPDQQLEVGGSIHISGEEDLSSTSVADGDGGLLYIKTNGKIYYKSNEVSETDLTASGGGGEANESSFKTISVSGQDNVVAEVDDDILTFAQAGGITLTTNATSDTVTISSADTNTTYSIQDGELSQNNFTNTDHTKLNGIEASADVTDATNVTAAGALMDSEVTNLAFVKALAKGVSDGNVLTANDVVADDDFLRINGTEVEGLTVAEVLTALNVEAGATADQSNAEIVAAVEAGSDSNTFTDTDHTKLNGIEASADVTDATNVTAAGALMDSEVTNLAFVKALAKGISDGQVLTANDVVADDDFLRINGTEVEGLTVAEVLTALNVEAGADVTDATNVTAAGALMDSELAGIAAVKATTGTFLSADESKLDGIEASADVTDATNVTAAGALMDSELAGIAAVKATTGTFLSADESKLDGIEASATADQTAGEILTLLEDGVDSVHYVDGSIDEAHLNATNSATDNYLLSYDSGSSGFTWVAAGGGSGTITSVVAGAGMTGGATSGAATLNVIGGTGITANADDIELTDNGVTLAKMAGLARGKIIYGDASGDPAALAVGDADQVLTHDGTDISWEDAGGGSARSVAGDTDNAIISWVTSDNTFAAEANLTFDGNAMVINNAGGAGNIPLTLTAHSGQTADLLQFQDSSGDELLVIDKGGSIKLGLGGDREVHVEPESGSNSAGKDLFLKGGKSTGNTEGGDIRFYTSPVGSSGVGVNNWVEAVKIRHDKVVDFKKAGGSKTVTLQNDAMDEYMSGTATVTVNATEWLEIKVNGNTRYIPVWS